MRARAKINVALAVTLLERRRLSRDSAERQAAGVSVHGRHGRARRDIPDRRARRPRRARRAVGIGAGRCARPSRRRRRRTPRSRPAAGCGSDEGCATRSRAEERSRGRREAPPQHRTGRRAAGRGETLVHRRAAAPVSAADACGEDHGAAAAKAAPRSAACCQGRGSQPRQPRAPATAAHRAARSRCTPAPPSTPPRAVTPCRSPRSTRASEADSIAKRLSARATRPTWRCPRATPDDVPRPCRHVQDADVKRRRSRTS